MHQAVIRQDAVLGKHPIGLCTEAGLEVRVLVVVPVNEGLSELTLRLCKMSANSVVCQAADAGEGVPMTSTFREMVMLVRRGQKVWKRVG